MADQRNGLIVWKLEKLF